MHAFHAMSGRRTAACVFFAGAISAIALGRLPLQGQSATEPLVARYARGDFSAVLSVTAERATELSSLRRDVKAATRLSPQTRAVFLIEAIDAAQHQPFSRVDAPWVIDEAIRGMFQDGCDLLKALQATDRFVRSWYAAAVAALAGGRAGQGRPVAGAQGGQPGIFARDAARFEGRVEPGAIVLGQALGIEALAWSGIYQSRASEYIAATTSPEFSDRIETGRRERTLQLEAEMVRRAVDALKRAEVFERVRAEAMLRQAALIAASGRPAEAIPMFEQSETLGGDQWVMYLAHLLKGRALEAAGQIADAEVAYAAALASRPRARSANLALAALTFTHGARADAALTTVFDPSADATDPWAQFRYGDYRFWPSRRDELRRALK
jgi:tetratricopeptide (TPR) repeat protein